MGKIPVKDLYEYLEMMRRDNWGYIYGTAGIMWTAEKQKALKEKYSEDDPKYGKSVKYGSQWIDHMVTDCSGVEPYIWKQYGLHIPHGSSSMVRDGYIIDCGPVPHPGWAALVDPTPSTPDNTHIGIVGEDGITIYEAKGAQSGFVTSTIHDKKWTKYGRFKDVDYEGGDEPVLIPPYRAKVNTASGALNVRSGPGTEYRKVAMLAKGTIVTVVTHGDEWDYINYGAIQGYVANRYLEPIQDPKPDPDPDPEDYVTVKLPVQKLDEYRNVLAELVNIFDMAIQTAKE